MGDEKIERIWKCKIGGKVSALPRGADLPMRRAAAQAFREVAGEDPEFLFTGWAGELTEGERAVVEDREPVYEKTETGKIATLEKRLEEAEKWNRACLEKAQQILLSRFGVAFGPTGHTVDALLVLDDRVKQAQSQLAAVRGALEAIEGVTWPPGYSMDGAAEMRAIAKKTLSESEPAGEGKK